MPSMNGNSCHSPAPTDPLPQPAGKKYWRSLNELANKPEFREFVEREFPAHASEWLGNNESRRTFLKVMGASIALAGLASCRRWPDEKLAPYAHRPANRMDGVPVHYASAYEQAGVGVGVVAVSCDGRPIKVDGNPTHPLTRGTSDIFLQASILNLYDPDRSRGVVQRSNGQRAESDWNQFAAALKAAGISNTGAGLVILCEATRSPTVAAARARLREAKFFEYEVVSNDNQRAGLFALAGRPLRAVPHLDQAPIIVSIDADLFFGEPFAIKYNREFAAGRMLRDSAKAADARMNRLYVLESGYTITGSMADHRRAVKPSQIPAIVAAIAGALGVSGGGGNLQASGLPQEVQEFVAALIADIRAEGGRRAVFVAGYRQPPEIHAAVAALNVATNAPIDYYPEPEDPRAERDWQPHAQQLQAFAAAIPAASAVLILGSNPILSAPADLQIADLLKNAKLTIHAGTHEDETAQACQWHLPLAHYLEAWGDVRTVDGTVSIVQPLIHPLFGARSIAEILALVAGEEKPGYDLVREAARNSYLRNFSEWAWKNALFEGVVANSAWTAETLRVEPARAAAALAALTRAPASAPAAGELELALHVGAAYDGRYANNGWLQELPDPMTRVTWENPVTISSATAEKLGLVSDDVVTLTAGDRQTEAVIYILPGIADDTLHIAFGYGRETLGAISQGVGHNAFALRTTAQPHFIPVKVARTGRRELVASVQDHHIIDAVGKKRLHTIVPELVVEGTLENYRKKPGLGARKIVALSMWNEHKYDPTDPLIQAKWGMAIDLSTCTGCSACVVACQAENNIPVVGKEQVYRGREMHWLRIDRYFKWGTDAGAATQGGTAPDTNAHGGGGHAFSEKGAPQVVHQPILCMHCETAPCEEVCPVAATTHSKEGLNMMTYNRCIGTRYCSNNCPYKVRRFNFFDYNAGHTQGEKANLYTPNLLRSDINELVKLQKNPQVTVRSRGVMEKCTYCVQRIEAARIQLRAENRTNANNAKFQDGAVITACQQACPTDAIVFGDLNQDGQGGRPLSKVRALHNLAQSYGLLDPELNTKPRTQYLAKVRNPLPTLDNNLYNEHTATHGFYWEHGTQQTHGNGAATQPGTHAPVAH